MRWKASDVAKVNRRVRQRDLPAAQGAPKKKGRIKGTVKVTVDDIVFASSAEARRYTDLKLAQRAGQCWFIRQPMFDLPGGVTCRADFLVVWNQGLAVGERVTVEDVTGEMTEQKTRNYKMVKALYGVEVEILAAHR